MLNKLLIIRKI